jgi:hypothetical protein
MPLQVSSTPIHRPEDLIALIRSQDTEAHERFFDFDVSVWYRGQADASHELTPGVFRKNFLEARSFSGPVASMVSPTEFGVGFERVFNAAFQRRAAAFLPPGVSLTEAYFLMQHHGMPTRLLDWSTNPLAALFFAVNQDYEKDGAVFILAPNELLNRGDLPSQPVGMDHCLVKNSVEHLFCNPPEGFEFERMVLPVFPNLVAGRMFQQSSCFTLHLPGCDKIEELNYANVQKFIIPAREKHHIQLLLRRMGVHYASIYYDLDNLAREMKAELLHPEAKTKSQPTAKGSRKR